MQKNNRTALVLGATGLVGGHLVRQLLDAPGWDAVRTFVRHTSGKAHAKLDEHVVDFEDLQSWKDALRGDALFSCLGTTIRKAGSQEAQYRVDFTYPFEAARSAAANGVQAYALVSSAGADSGSRVFYSRMKGELDDAVQKLGFSAVRILRPSLLLGQRTERRLGERLAEVSMGWMAYVPIVKKYRGIPAEMVARGLRSAVQEVLQQRDTNTQPDACVIYTWDDIFRLAEQIEQPSSSSIKA